MRCGLAGRPAALFPFPMPRFRAERAERRASPSAARGPSRNLSRPISRSSAKGRTEYFYSPVIVRFLHLGSVGCDGHPLPCKPPVPRLRDNLQVNAHQREQSSSIIITIFA